MSHLVSWDLLPSCCRHDYVIREHTLEARYGRECTGLQARTPLRHMGDPRRLGRFTARIILRLNDRRGFSGPISCGACLLTDSHYVGLIHLDLARWTAQIGRRSPLR